MPRIINFNASLIQPDEKAPIISETPEASGASSFNADELTLNRNLQMLQKLYKEKLNYTVKETSNIINLSYEFTRNAIKKGKIKSKSFGDRPMVSLHELARILTEGIDG